jgi:hypothetical protein
MDMGLRMQIIENKWLICKILWNKELAKLAGRFCRWLTDVFLAANHDYFYCNKLRGIGAERGGV